MGAKTQRKVSLKSSNSKYHKMCLGISIIVNLIFTYKTMYSYEESWTRKAAEEAERVADISCSGHGRSFLDGITCECNSCYGGSDCSLFDSSCSADVDGGDPLFLEPFWIRNAAISAVVIAGWHRMSYTFNDQSFMSKELENVIRKLHSQVGNALTRGRYMVFGAGATQLLNAAVHSLSSHNCSSSPANIVASIPFYPVYQLQTEFFQSLDFRFQGDTSLWKNKPNMSMDMIEFVASPDNPNGRLKNVVLQGSNVQAIYDRAYYWPHFTAIPAPADEDMNIFTLSKLTGHAGSRFGWAIVKDKAIYEKMVSYLNLNTIGVSRESQLRALKLLKVALKEGENNLFQFAHQTMRKRWVRLNQIISMTGRFSLQKIPPEYCTYINKVRDASPAYGWLKCEREEDKDCHAVLRAAKINGRRGAEFFASDRYVRVSLIRSQDDIDLFFDKLNQLVSKENDAPKSI